MLMFSHFRDVLPQTAAKVMTNLFVGFLGHFMVRIFYPACRGRVSDQFQKSGGNQG